jgi:hypothetical protein
VPLFSECGSHSHGILRQLRLRGVGRRIYFCDIEPGEKFIRRFLKFVFMILAFIIAIVFGEVSFGTGWFGAVIFIIGASMGGTGRLSLEGFEKLIGTSPLGQRRRSHFHPVNERDRDFSTVID